MSRVWIHGPQGLELGVPEQPEGYDDPDAHGQWQSAEWHKGTSEVLGCRVRPVMWKSKRFHAVWRLSARPGEER
jgi:hypothetical protein